jgi:hypothetical protein
MLLGGPDGHKLQRAQEDRGHVRMKAIKSRSERTAQADDRNSRRSMGTMPDHLASYRPESEPGRLRRAKRS